MRQGTGDCGGAGQQVWRRRWQSFVCTTSHTHPHQHNFCISMYHNSAFEYCLITSMYSLTFCVRVMLPERHLWKLAVQAATVMMRTPPVDGQSPASSAHTPRRAFASCRHIAGWTQACNQGSRYVAIATQPVHRLQIRPIVHNQGAASTTPPSYIQVRAVVWAYGRGQTDRPTHTHTDTQTRVTTIHFASSTTHAKCNKKSQAACHLPLLFAARLKAGNMTSLLARYIQFPQFKLSQGPTSYVTVNSSLTIF